MSPQAWVAHWNPALGEDADRLLVLRGSGPERLGPHPLRVRLDQPAGAGLDHAVDEELGHAAAPEPAAHVPAGKLRPHLLEAELRVLPERDDHPHAQVAPCASISRSKSNVAGEPSMAWMPVRPTAFNCRIASTYQRYLSSAVALGMARADQLHRPALAQLAGRDAVVVDDHRRVVGEGLAAGHVGERERGRRGDAVWPSKKAR